jgi:hypothetical protein
MITFKERHNRNGTYLYKRHKKLTKANSTKKMIRDKEIGGNVPPGRSDQSIDLKIG